MYVKKTIKVNNNSSRLLDYWLKGEIKESIVKNNNYIKVDINIKGDSKHKNSKTN